MIKKQLGLLAGSVMVAATSNAAITLGNDSLAVFSTAGQGSYYQLVAGSTADSLVSGSPFSVDISAAAAALGGTIDSFALLAVKAGSANNPGATYPSFNYDEGLYVESNGGLVFAGDTPANTTNLEAQNGIGALNIFLAGADLGFNGEGSVGDFDALAANVDFLNSGFSNVIFNEQLEAGESTNSQLVLSGLNQVGVDIGAATFGSAVPVPAAAWLFGSALLGLGVVRRRK